MAIALISDWLKLPNPTYAQGVYLYERYGKSTALLTLFKSGNSPFHYRKLSQALQEINEQVEPVVVQPKKTVPNLSDFERTAQPSKTTPDFDSLPDRVKDVVSLKNKTYARARHLHMQLRVVTNEQERGEIALQLLDDMEQVNSYWAAIDSYTKTGEMEAEIVQEAQKTIAEMSVPEMVRYRANLPTYITKAKKRISSLPEGDKKAKALHKLHGFMAELEELKRRLNESV